MPCSCAPAYSSSRSSREDRKSEGFEEAPCLRRSLPDSALHARSPWSDRKKTGPTWKRSRGVCTQALLDAHPALRLFGHAEKRLPGSLNVGFPGLPAEEVIRNISDHLAVSSGSACASATSEPSRVLLALGLDPEVAATGVRISLGRFTAAQDIDRAIAALSKLAPLAQLDHGA